MFLLDLGNVDKCLGERVAADPVECDRDAHAHEEHSTSRVIYKYKNCRDQVACHEADHRHRLQEYLSCRNHHFTSLLYC